MLKNDDKAIGIIGLAVSLTFYLLLIGCNKEFSGEEKFAYVSVNNNSQYTKTFDDLHLGIIYDFNLKLTEADKSWVTLWVEGYKNGEKTDPYRLIELSYGLHPEPGVSEGPLGFGIINPHNENTSFFMYSPDASISHHLVEDILNSNGASTWGYAIGEEEVVLEPGETKLLAVYRKAGSSLRTYDYQDINQVTQMINEDIAVLLLKIKVEKTN